MVVDVTPDHVQRTSPKSKMRAVGPEDGTESASGDGSCEDGMMPERCDREGGCMGRDAGAGRWRVQSGYSAHGRKKERQGFYIARIASLVCVHQCNQIVDFPATHLGMT